MSALAPIGNPDPDFRSTHVGASEVAALYGVSPYLTEFELFHRKRGAIATPNFAEDERSRWGVLLEPAIIAEAMTRYGYEDCEQPDRLSNGKGLGGHPDRRVICPQRGRGIIEVKMVDWIQRKSWGDEPPAHYLLQSNTYQGLDGANWGDIIVLVGGNALERHQREFRPVLYADTEKRVLAFWQAVCEDRAPSPEYARDGAALAAVLGTPTQETADLHDDLDAEQWAIDFRAAKAAEREAVTAAEIAKTRLIERIGTAGFAMLPGHRISAGMTKGSAGTLVTQDMVGTYVGARKGWRRFDVKEFQGGC